MFFKWSLQYLARLGQLASQKAWPITIASCALLGHAIRPNPFDIFNGKLHGELLVAKKRIIWDKLKDKVEGGDEIGEVGVESDEFEREGLEWKYWTGESPKFDGIAVCMLSHG